MSRFIVRTGDIGGLLLAVRSNGGADHADLVDDEDVNLPPAGLGVLVVRCTRSAGLLEPTPTPAKE